MPTVLTEKVVEGSDFPLSFTILDTAGAPVTPLTNNWVLYDGDDTQLLTGVGDLTSTFIVVLPAANLDPGTTVNNAKRKMVVTITYTGFGGTRTKVDYVTFEIQNLPN